MLLLNEVAAMLGLRPHQVIYAITSRSVEDVALRIGNRRVFQASEIERLANHFGITLQTKEKNG